jgi:hypothetical protein
MRRNQGLIWGTLVVLAAISAKAAWQGGDDRQPAPPAARASDVELSTFMRKKLEAANKIMEGLCVEDMGLVKEGANALNELSTAERWRVSNDVMYRQFSTEFQSLTRELVKAADAGNPDRVALKWMDATLSCLDCHRFVRGMRVAGDVR